MARKLPNWVDAFEQYTTPIASPDIFKRWGGIAAIAGALERKVWINSAFGETFPNLYTVLVAPAGVGKTAVTERVRRLWLKLTNHHLASTSVTKAFLMDELNAAERAGPILPPMRGTGTFKFNSLKILSNELGVLLPGYDSDFMNVLTDLWDGHVYSEGRRSTKKQFVIEKPQLNLLAATTPSYLNDVMPVGAWSQGFISRVMLIYSGERILQSPFGDMQEDETLFKALASDLNHIGSLYGKMVFSEDAANAFVHWHMSGGKPAPDHPRLVEGYMMRRTHQLFKLCMIACASESDDFEITLDHYVQALNWLTEAEVYMPDIFKAMNAGGDSRIMEETWHHVYKLYLDKKQPISEHRVVAFIQQRAPAHSVMRILEVMVRGGLLREQVELGKGKAYAPGTRA